jgi:MobA/MobL family
MATFYLRTRTGLACKSAGAKHSAYIAGEDKYTDKDEVKFVIDKNLPKWAKDGKDFFTRADQLERSNGRSYRSLVIAIPLEAKNKVEWAQNYVDDLLKDKHAYRLAIHDDGNGNPHAHLMFCERGRNNENKIDDPKAYFIRANPKDSNIKTNQWLKDAKTLYLEHIHKVAPDYKPSLNRAEPKIGPKLKNASDEYEVARNERKAKVNDLRQLSAVDELEQSQIAMVQKFIESEKRATIKVVNPKPTQAPRSPLQAQVIPKTAAPSKFGAMAAKATLKIKAAGKPPTPTGNNPAVDKAKSTVAQHMPAVAQLLQAVSSNADKSPAGQAAKACVDGVLLGLAGVCQRIEDSEKITQQYKAFQRKYDAENGLNKNRTERENDRVLALASIVKEHQQEQAKPRPEPPPRREPDRPRPRMG